MLIQSGGIIAGYWYGVKWKFAQCFRKPQQQKVAVDFSPKIC
jgi:hypothetical protein